MNNNNIYKFAHASHTYTGIQNLLLQNSAYGPAFHLTKQVWLHTLICACINTYMYSTC